MDALGTATNHVRKSSYLYRMVGWSSQRHCRLRGRAISIRVGVGRTGKAQEVSHAKNAKSQREMPPAGWLATRSVSYWDHRAETQWRRDWPIVPALQTGLSSFALSGLDAATVAISSASEMNVPYSSLPCPTALQNRCNLSES